MRNEEVQGLEQELRKVDDEIRCKKIEKGDLGFEIKGDEFEIPTHRIGSVAIICWGIELMTLKEVNGREVIELNCKYIDLLSAELIGQIITICGKYAKKEAAS